MVKMNDLHCSVITRLGISMLRRPTFICVISVVAREGLLLCLDISLSRYFFTPT